jgi:pyruvate dehydrogenase E2 component (dihydrolipoamide acetyltransferase)
MPVEIKLPSLGEGVDSGDVLEVLVSEGDTIEKDQGIVELETDKATVTVPSTAAGKVTKVAVAEGDTVSPGDVLIAVEASASSKDAKSETGKSEAQKKAPQQKSESKSEKPAAKAESKSESNRQSASESKPDKKKSPPAEKKRAEPVRADREMDDDNDDDYAERSLSEVSSMVDVAHEATEMGQVAAGPAIRRFAREVGVDLRRVSGSGEHGRITRDDVLKVVRGGGQSFKHSPSDTKTGRPDTQNRGTGDSDAYGPVRIEKMPKIRRTIAKKMHESWETCPRVTNFDDADVTDLETIRHASKADYAAKGIKLTSMPFLIKAVAMSLKSNPVINASVDMEEGTIIYKEYVNVGIAVDTERGLIVPSLRMADKLSIPEIAKGLTDIAERARSNNFEIEELRGSSFTISNLGSIGGTYSTPIINIPETAILLTGRSRKMPVVVNDEIKIRLMMPLSISYDHRLIDGAAAARFLNDVKGYLQAPSRLLMAL